MCIVGFPHVPTCFYNGIIWLEHVSKSHEKCCVVYELYDFGFPYLGFGFKQRKAELHFSYVLLQNRTVNGCALFATMPCMSSA